MGTTPFGTHNGQIRTAHYALQHNGRMATSLVHKPKQRALISYAQQSNPPNSPYALHKQTHKMLYPNKCT